MGSAASPAPKTAASGHAAAATGGNYFRTGNAAIRFNRIDRYVVARLHRLMRKRYGRHLRPGQSKLWTREWFEAHGLYRLRRTVRYPAPAS